MFFKSTKSVDQIVASFARTIRELDETAQMLVVRAQSARDQVARLLANATQDEQEADRAERIAKNLHNLLGE